MNSYTPKNRKCSKTLGKFCLLALSLLTCDSLLGEAKSFFYLPPNTVASGEETASAPYSTESYASYPDESDWQHSGDNSLEQQNAALKNEIAKMQEQAAQAAEEAAANTDAEAKQEMTSEIISLQSQLDNLNSYAYGGPDPKVPGSNYSALGVSFMVVVPVLLIAMIVGAIVAYKKYQESQSSMEQLSSAGQVDRSKKLVELANVLTDGEYLDGLFKHIVERDPQNMQKINVSKLHAIASYILDEPRRNAIIEPPMLQAVTAEIQRIVADYDHFPDTFKKSVKDLFKIPSTRAANVAAANIAAGSTVDLDAAIADYLPESKKIVAGIRARVVAAERQRQLAQLRAPLVDAAAGAKPPSPAEPRQTASRGIGPNAPRPYYDPYSPPLVMEDAGFEESGPGIGDEGPREEGRERSVVSEAQPSDKALFGKTVEAAPAEPRRPASPVRRAVSPPRRAVVHDAAV